MNEGTITLNSLSIDQTARILKLEGGEGFQRKLRVMGIREGQIIKIVTRQPFKGPITIAVCGSQMTLGRGMASKVSVEVIK